MPESPSSDLHTAVRAMLARDDQRYTGGRRALVEALAASERPATIRDLLEADPGAAISSAYRNLAVLERAGAVRRIVTSDEHARFELAEELSGHHHHAVCRSCGAVEDFTVSPQLERSVEAALAKIASELGYQPEHHQLDLVGTCRNCT